MKNLRFDQKKAALSKHDEGSKDQQQSPSAQENTGKLINRVGS